MIKIIKLSLFAFVLGFSLPQTLLAHERRATEDYLLVVGHKHEPAFAAVPNAFDLSITRITGLDKPINARAGDTVDLEVFVQFCGHDPVNCGDHWVPLAPPRQAYGTDNRYHSDYLPTESGVYAFRLTGVIAEAQPEQEGNADGTAAEGPAPFELDEIFICGEESFGCVAQPLVVPSPSP